MFRRAMGQRPLERLDIVIPEVALAVVAGADLPLPRRVVEALLEAGELFLRRDVQEEFQDGRVVVGPSNFSQSLMKSNRAFQTSFGTSW